MNDFILFEKKTSKVTFVIFVFILQTQISIKNSIYDNKKHQYQDSRSTIFMTYPVRR